ncbi:MAG TPA: hypothetical protein VMF69_17600 [Gemmataceae bacterium]|nr:hypothetical protein [Gemmataceae bacterium]
MDQATLVEEQIDDAQKFINLLLEEGFDVTAAAWVKPTARDEWRLYIVSKVVEEESLAAAYRALHPALQRLGMPWLLLESIKLIGVSNPIALDILDIQRRFAARIPTRSRTPRLGEMAVDETYVYPEPVRPEEKWRAISVMVFPEVERADTYCVEFWPRQLQAAMEPGGQPQRVPSPARVWVEGERISAYRPPEKPLPHFEQADYEEKAVQAVRQVARKSA